MSIYAEGGSLTNLRHFCVSGDGVLLLHNLQFTIHNVAGIMHIELTERSVGGDKIGRGFCEGKV